MGISQIANYVRERHAQAVTTAPPPGATAAATEAYTASVADARSPTDTIIIDAIYMLTNRAEGYGTAAPFAGTGDRASEPPTFEWLADRVAGLVKRLVRTRPRLREIYFTCDMMWNVPLLKQEEWARRNATGWQKWTDSAASSASPPIWAYSASPDGPGFAPLTPTDADGRTPLGLMFYRGTQATEALLTDRTIRAFVLSFIFGMALEKLSRLPISHAVRIVVLHPIFRSGAGADGTRESAAFNLVRMGGPDESLFAPNVLVTGTTEPTRGYFWDGLHTGEGDVQAMWILDQLFAVTSPYRMQDIGVEVHNNDSDMIPILLLAYHGLFRKNLHTNKHVSLWSGRGTIVAIHTLHTHIDASDTPNVPEMVMLWLLASDTDFAEPVRGMPRSVEAIDELVATWSSAAPLPMVSRASPQLVYSPASIFPSTIEINMNAWMRVLAATYMIRVAKIPADAGDFGSAGYIQSLFANTPLFDGPLDQNARDTLWDTFHKTHQMEEFGLVHSTTEPGAVHTWKQYRALFENSREGAKARRTAATGTPFRVIVAGRFLGDTSAASPAHATSVVASENWTSSQVHTLEKLPPQLRFPFPGFVEPRALWERAVKHAWTLAYWLGGHRSPFSGSRKGAAPRTPPMALGDGGFLEIDLDASRELHWLYTLSGRKVRAAANGRFIMLSYSPTAPLPMIARGVIEHDELTVLRIKLYTSASSTIPPGDDVATAFAHTNLSLTTAYSPYTDSAFTGLVQLDADPDIKRDTLYLYERITALKNVELVAMLALTGLGGQDWRSLLVTTMSERSRFDQAKEQWVFPDEHLCFVLAEVTLMLAADGYAISIVDGRFQVGPKARMGDMSRVLLLPPEAEVRGDVARRIRVVARNVTTTPATGLLDAPNALPEYAEHASLGVAMPEPAVVDDGLYAEVNPTGIVTPSAVYMTVEATDAATREDAAKFYYHAANRATPVYGRVHFADAAHALEELGMPGVREGDMLSTRVQYAFAASPSMGGPAMRWEQAAFFGTLSASLRVSDYALPLLRQDAGAEWHRLASRVALVGPLMEAAWLGLIEWKIAASVWAKMGGVPENRQMPQILDAPPRGPLDNPTYHTWVFAYLGKPEALAATGTWKRLHEYSINQRMLTLHKLLPPTADMKVEFIPATNTHRVYFHKWDSEAVRAYIFFSHKTHAEDWEKLKSGAAPFSVQYLHVRG